MPSMTLRTYEDAFAESCAISGIAADERAYLRSGGRGRVTLDPPEGIRILTLSAGSERT